MINKGAIWGILLLIFCLQILPCEFREAPLAVDQTGAAPALRFEPLQVCDHGDSHPGSLVGVPLLLPTPPAIFLSMEIKSLQMLARLLAAEGFERAIDRPPRSCA